MARTTPGRPLDLQSPPTDPWGDVDVPEGWMPVAQLCRQVAARLEDLTDHVVGCIAAEIPAYTREATVPHTDLLASVFRNIEMMLIGIAEHRGATAGELRVRRELGARRAVQGLPVEALLQAYHVGYRELWHALVAEATHEGPETSLLLLGAATTVWGWIHEVTNVVAEAYLEAARRQEARVAGIRQHFLDLLLTGDLASPELAEICRSLGIDPDGEFLAVTARTAGMDVAEEHVQQEVSTLEGTHLCMARGHQLLVVSQDASTEDVEERIKGLLPQGAIGVGLLRSRLEGARLSIGDAELALAISARRGGVARFENDWFLALSAQADERLAAMLGPGATVAVRNPDLASTIETLADAGFSPAEAARRLSIHLNTVISRLERWERLTGWNPRQLGGLLRSLASISAARRK